MKLVTFNDKEYLKNLLLSDKVIAFPTETVFGLGAISSSEKAFNNLVKVKNRTPDKPFTLMCSNVEQIKKFAVVDEVSAKLIKKFMPGSITLILKVLPNVPKYITLGTEFIGVRIPENKELIDLIDYVGEPLLVPSANKSGDAPALTHEQVKEIFDKEISACVKGTVNKSVPSTIVKVDNGIISLLRNGPIKYEDILKEIE